MKSCHHLLIGLGIALAAGPVAYGQEDAEAESQSGLAISSGGLQIGGRTDEERIKLLLEVAAVYYQEKDYDAAMSAYERILEIDPANRETLFIIGHVYIYAHQYAKAEETLIQLMEQYPDDFHVKNNLAWLYATAEDPAFRNGEKAVELAQEAMVLAPNDHHIWSTLAEAYYVTGQYEKAYRAIVQMAQLAGRYGKDINEAMVAEYNEQIRKCRRAMESEKAMKGEEQEDGSTTNAPAGTPSADATQ